MEQEDKKKPHITMVWIAIAVLLINQAVVAYRCCESQRLLWDDLIHQSEIVKSHIEDTIQYEVELNKLLVEQKRALEHQKQALEHQNQILKEYCK